MQSQKPTFFRGVWMPFYHDEHGWMTANSRIAKLWVRVMGPFA